MGEPSAAADYELLSDRLALLERELEWARLQRDGARVAELCRRMAELRCARQQLRQSATCACC